jgi:hypothetical protein
MIAARRVPLAARRLGPFQRLRRRLLGGTPAPL